MSALLIYRPLTFVPWKDRSFNQITTSIQKNKNTNTSRINLFLPNPQKIYRREIATSNSCNSANPRFGVSVDEINQPGGSIVNTSYAKGNVQLQIINKTNNKTENGTCTNPFVCAEQNARNRVRNSKMLRPKHVQYTSYADGTTTSVAFFNNTKQYLNNRMMSFEKNQNILSNCVVFKPSNTAYKVQGAVSSSAQVLGRKIDAMDQAAAMYRKTNGYNLAGALSYGVNENINNYKEKLGYPLANTPIVRPGTNTICKQELATLRGKTG